MQWGNGPAIWSIRAFSAEVMVTYPISFSSRVFVVYIDEVSIGDGDFAIFCVPTQITLSTCWYRGYNVNGGWTPWLVIGI